MLNPSRMDIQGLIFNIQKFSIHDGPGIRTVVFMKGCPLRCRWCSNPESQTEKMQLAYDKEKCSMCLTCIDLCPQKGIAAGDGKIILDQSLCVVCGTCVQNCPNKALSIEGAYRSVNEVFNVCMQDLDFYEESGGGVTFSGGEPLMWPEFVLTLSRLLKRQGIHIAIETTGYASPEVFRQVADEIDLLLFDLKHYDSEKHKEGTDICNDLIVSNLIGAFAGNKDVLVRIPVIPGYNDSLDDARSFAKLLISVGAKRVQLLPFHQFGEKKYELLDMHYTLANQRALYPEDLLYFRNALIDSGIDCFF